MFTSNAPQGNEAYVLSNGISSTDPLITYFSNRDPTQYDYNFPIKKRWFNLTDINEWILVSYSNVTGQTLANWVLVASGGSASLEFIQVDSAVLPGVNPVAPTAGNIIKFGEQFALHNPIPTGTNSAGYLTVTRDLNELGIELQLAGSNPGVSTANNFGISQFDSNQFDVTAGYVQLKGNGVNPALTKLAVQTGITPVVPDATGKITFNGATVLAGVNPVRTDGTGANTVALEVQITQGLAAADVRKIGLSNFDSAKFTVDSATGFVTASGTGILQTLSDNVNTQVSPLNGNIQLKGQLNEQSSGFFSTTVSDAANNLIKINPMSSARWIVDPLSTATNPNGTHTTIASAITSATSGDTVLILPGTYTENLTLKAGVNLTAYGCDSSLNATGKVIISGNATMSTAGTVSISGIQLQTNSAAFLTVSGSVASIVNLYNCYLNCTNATGISFSSSSSSATINLNCCSGNISTTGISLFASSSAGRISSSYTRITNSGLSTTASTISAGIFGLGYSDFAFPITTSGTASLECAYSRFALTTNTTALTSGGSGGHIAVASTFESGSASAITITNTLNLRNCYISSSNTNAISGAGILNYTGLIFTDTSFKISTTTQTGGTLQGGLTQAPSAGYLGEYFINTGTSVSITSGANSNIASISLTPGIWNISISCNFINTGSTTVFKAGISDTSATFLNNTSIDTVVWSTGTAITSGQFNLGLDDYRVVNTSPSKTYYLVATSTFTTGTSAASGGTIRATRVG